MSTTPIVRGTELARQAEGGVNPHADLMEAMRDDLLLVLMNRLCSQAGTTSIDIPVSEIDDAGRFLLALSVDFDKRIFHFELQEKS